MHDLIYAKASALFLVFVGALEAQRVSGTVRDAVDRRPIAGVVVSILDAGGATEARTLSDPQGRFIVAASERAAMVQLRRIGYRPLDLPLSTEVRSGGAQMEIILERIPVVLDPVRSTASRCPEDAAAPRALALWEQAQYAFLASLVARDAPGAASRILRYRKLETRGFPDETHVAIYEQDSLRLFVTARPQENLAEGGYVVATGGESGVATLIFDGPDADVLMGAPFRDAHCFSLADPDRARRGQIGVAFEPAPGRQRLTDIAGVLWMDQSPLSLRALEFGYRGLLPSGTAAAGGGGIEFRTASNGMVVVTEWSLRLQNIPMAITETTAVNRGAARTVRGSRESGGVLLSASWSGGDTVTTPLPTLSGRVVTNRTATAVAGAMISIPNTPYRATTSIDGNFALADVFPSTYMVTVADSALSGFGVVPRSTAPLTIARGPGLPVNLQLPSPLETAWEGCGKNRLGRGPGAVAIRAVDSTGRLLTDSLTATANHFDFRGRQIGTVTVYLTAGHFIVCGYTPGRFQIDLRDRTRQGIAALEVEGTAVLDTITVVVKSIPATARASAAAPERQTRTRDPQEKGSSGIAGNSPLRATGIHDEGLYG